MRPLPSVYGKIGRPLYWSLSNPSKMPGKAYGIPAQECKTGSVLRKIDGSVCFHCYALKGCYQYPVVKTAQANRLATVTRAIINPQFRKLWVDDIAGAINRLREPFFRWHDSGDIQCPEHVALIALVCLATPTVAHWLPHKEKAIMRAWERSGGVVPPNLTVRLSAAMVGSVTTSADCTSSVGSGIGHACPAYSQDGHCGDCRACWDSAVQNVDYPLH